MRKNEKGANKKKEILKKCLLLFILISIFISLFSCAAEIPGSYDETTEQVTEEISLVEAIDLKEYRIVYMLPEDNSLDRRAGQSATVIKNTIKDNTGTFPEKVMLKADAELTDEYKEVKNT